MTKRKPVRIGSYEFRFVDTFWTASHRDGGTHAIDSTAEYLLRALLRARAEVKRLKEAK